MNVEFDSISTRDAFGEALAELARENSKIMYVAADTLKSVGGTKMHGEFPDRAINIGIAEQNMALMAAGIASCGAKVFAASYATFASMRICEQVRTFIAYPKLDVKIVAGLGGLSGGIEGVTHQGTEDIGIMRSIANMTVVCAADAASTKKITRAIAAYDGPVYLRLGRAVSPRVFDDSYTFQIGKANVLQTGKDVLLVGYGSTIGRCINAAKILEEKGISCSVVETPCLKPFDDQTIAALAAEAKLVVTAEDHNVIGGVGSAVMEALCEAGIKVPVIRMGLQDSYAQSGECEELLDYYGLSPAHIAETVISSGCL